MNTRNLSESEFTACFAEPMVDVTKSPREVIDIWPYVEAIPFSDLAGHCIPNARVDNVYRNVKQELDHVLVATNTNNVYLVVVVDVRREEIRGHHLLDLNEKYGVKVRPE